MNWLDRFPLRAPHPVLMALEGRAFFEWSSLAVSWPILKRAPAGDGHPVLVLPGLVANDTSTWPIRRFLNSRGYAAYPWRQGFNIGPVDNLVERLEERLDTLHRRHGRTVSLIGWSLGGAMARALAVRMPEHVRSVITLGSPIQAEHQATNAWRIFELVSGWKADDPRLAEWLLEHPMAPSTSFLSKTDGIVNWRISMAPEHELSENIEVSASHMGMGANPIVLWAIADRLAQAEGEWKPLARDNPLRSLLYRDPKKARLADLIATRG
ncbi:lipase family alpha/beta hydrolase [Wenzhouxiangella marina]|uniref:Alpha/beta hydrolase n=1 Tax=Wenzhouxiangella marina TaxID=1579979 RepID=A0A0K0XUL3_9GAMM|nr:alpha/beta fold hydrolase [Wenzhouxiangella marina]AKS41404.1 alpha/beta hydrolase [Wenzhouxiangella marina]MBB6086842.1 pimeloyl-ACP methyl ester carboxylesterase [Wenzhouxiangella marina]